MLKKLVYALALTGLASGQAFALTDAGFENANNWVTPVGGLTRVQYGAPEATVHVIEDAIPGVAPRTLADVVVDAVSASDLAAASGVASSGVGSSFGLIETCAANILAANCSASQAYTFNLGGPVSNYGDFFLVRLMTADYETPFNDKVTVTYYGTSGVLATDHVSVFSEVPGDQTWIETQGYWDSNWAAFGVPVGTNAISVQVENRADSTAAGYLPGDELYNRPVVAVDYAPAMAVTPVPEADVTAMMLAGLGVLGMVSRRRAKRAA